MSKRAKKPKLTPKQQAFVREYLKDLNALQAALRAGYSERTARVIGPENLTKPAVMGAIRKSMDKRAAKLELSQEMVARELAKIAFADGSDYAEIITQDAVEMVDGPDGASVPVVVQRQGIKFKDTADLTKDQRAAIASIKRMRGGGIAVDRYDKVKALELLGKHLAMFTDRLEVQGDHRISIAVPESFLPDADADSDAAATPDSAPQAVSEQDAAKSLQQEPF